MDYQVIAIAAAAILYALAQVAKAMGWLPTGPIETSARRRAAEAEEELSAANLTIKAQAQRLEELERRTDLQPIVDALIRVAELQDRTLDKLADLNGGLIKTADSLATTMEAVKFLAGQVLTKEAL